MLKIRLKRIGRIKQPCYKIVVVENLSKRDGKPLQEIGYYNSIHKKIYFDKKALYKYIHNGAHPTSTVRHLIYTYIFKNKQ